MVEVKARFLNIEKCGFYLKRSRTLEFGSITSVFDDLLDWSSEIDNIENTKTFEGGELGQIKNVYFLDGYKSTENNDFVLILWNESENSNGKMYGINPSQPVGSRDMLSTEFLDPSAIPGVPSYFWIISDKKLCICMKFGHSVQGKIPFDHYINSFLSNFSSFRILNSKDEIVGYSKDGSSSDDGSTMCPRFETKTAVNDAVKLDIVSKSGSITHIIKKETLDYNDIDDRSSIEKFFSGLLADVPQVKGVESRHVYHRMQFSPTSDQVTEIIDAYRSRSSQSNITHAGFQFSDSSTVMLDRVSISQEIDLDFKIKEGEVVDPKTIMKSLAKIRPKLLKDFDSMGSKK
jgi:hypothetical protein